MKEKTGVPGFAPRVWAYRNTIKALNWYSSVREKLDDPKYSCESTSNLPEADVWPKGPRKSHSPAARSFLSGGACDQGLYFPFMFYVDQGFIYICIFRLAPAVIESLIGFFLHFSLQCTNKGAISAFSY